MRISCAGFILAGCIFLGFSVPVLATACRPGGRPHYSIAAGAVVYDFYGAKTRLAEVDAANFKAIPLPQHALGPCEHAEDEFYGADRSHVFYEGGAIPGADPVSFRPLAEYEYSEDGKSVFYRGQILPGADPASFRILIWPDDASLKRPPGEKFSIYAVDARHVWEQGRLMPAFDAATFTLLPMNYVRDKNGVYRNDRLVPGLDPRTFDGRQQH
jgi:hypothetical protein